MCNSDKTIEKNTPEIKGQVPFILAVSVLAAMFLFHAAANSLYPFRGDDFQLQNMLKYNTCADIIKDTYFNWTLRLGNIVHIFVSATGSKLLFNILNTVIQTLIPYFTGSAAAGRLLDIRKSGDAILLTAACGTSFFTARSADTVFWTCGAVLYSWSTLVYLGFLIYFLSCIKKNKTTFPQLALLFFWGFAGGYCNENTSITGLLFFGICAFVLRKKSAVTALAGWISGSIFLFATPGIVKRLAHAGANGETSAFSNIFRRIPEAAAFFTASNAVLLAMLVFVLLIFRKELTRKTAVKLSVICALALFSALVFAGCPSACKGT